ncbi:MAG: shikimate kinase [Deltaproteobacteria bacterium]|nr:shikimate kinase [Deltaproteobacteria bacterium]
MIIFLTGYRCTGKTSVGKTLANKLKLPFVDADLLLVEEYGVTISEMVAKEGWQPFREKESRILTKICKMGDRVVATGGGVILDKKNVSLMKANGTCVWLKAGPETIKKRIVQDEKTEDSRPSLTSKGLLGEIEDTLSERNPLYEDAMDFSVDTDERQIKEICEIIVKRLKVKG